MEKLRSVKARQFTIDILLNLLASFTPLLILQILVLPSLSKHLGDEKYGLLVTIIAMMNAVPGVLGNALNNIRLLNNDSYKSVRIKGDFNLILLLFTAIGSLVVIIGTVYYEGRFDYSTIITTLLAILWIYREYSVVAFRINLNYSAILINNVLLAIGYLLGYFLVILAEWQWQWIYVIGLCFSIGYIVSKSAFHREPIRKTNLFNKYLSDSITMSFAGFLSRLITYADKLLIFPVLGAQAVAVYYASSVFSKSVMMAVTPVTGVVLTYVAKLTKRPRPALAHVLVIFVLGIVSYIVSILLSIFLLNKLYPEYVEMGSNLVYFTAFSAVLEAMSSLISPLVLRFNKVKWQLRISLVINFFYLALVIPLAKMYSLMGFGMVLCVASMARLILLIWVYMMKQDTEDQPQDFENKTIGEN